jgi:hypothetical protein
VGRCRNNPSEIAGCCALENFYARAASAVIKRSYRRESTQIHQHLEVNPVWAPPVLSIEIAREAGVTLGFAFFSSLSSPVRLREETAFFLLMRVLWR